MPQGFCYCGNTKWVLDFTELCWFWNVQMIRNGQYLLCIQSKQFRLNWNNKTEQNKLKWNCKLSIKDNTGEIGIWLWENFSVCLDKAWPAGITMHRTPGVGGGNTLRYFHNRHIHFDWGIHIRISFPKSGCCMQDVLFSVTSENKHTWTHNCHTKMKINQWMPTCSVCLERG